MAVRKELDQREGFGIGASGVLLIFVVLALVSFSALALVSARADKNISARYGEYVKEYFSAEEKAFELLAQIDQKLNAAYKNDKENYIYAAADSIKEIDGVTVFKDQANNFNANYYVKINAEQQLNVVIKLEKEKNTFYTIIKWQTENNSLWQADQTLPIIKKDKTEANSNGA